MSQNSISNCEVQENFQDKEYCSNCIKGYGIGGKNQCVDEDNRLCPYCYQCGSHCESCKHCICRTCETGYLNNPNNPNDCITKSDGGVQYKDVDIDKYRCNGDYIHINIFIIILILLLLKIR